MSLSPNMRGALFISISMAGFITNDALTKLVVNEMSYAQIMLMRGGIATLFVAGLAWHVGALARPGLLVHPMVAVRVVCEVGATLSFLAALAYMQLGSVIAVLQALPLAVTLGAALVLGEPVGLRRWIAILVGFVGVMIIVRPGFDGFDSYALFAVVTVALSAVRDLVTQRIPPEIPSVMISTATAATIAVVGALLVPAFGGWTAPGLYGTAVLTGAAITMLVGFQFVIQGLREGEISFVAPFRYTALIWAMLLGFLMFSEIPDLPMIVGSAIIVVSGFYTLYRERKVNAERPAARSTGPGMSPDGL